MSKTILFPTSIELPKNFHAIEVGSIQLLTSDAVKISFIVPDSLQENYRFKPGQHIDLLLQENDLQLRRSYSICSGPGEPLSIAVKHIPGGLVSGFLNTSVRGGDQLAVSTPHGSFVLNEEARQITLFGAGSGITPLLSMLKFAVARDIKVTLIYGNQTLAATMFRQDIAELYTVKTVHLLSRENREGYISGRITDSSLSAIAAHHSSILTSDACYICGPAEMITSVRNFLEKSGYPAHRIHQEFFHAPITTENVPSKDSVQNEIPEYHLQLVLEGDKHSFIINLPEISLLDALLAKGLKAPFSCKSGVCGSCRAKVLKGSVVMKANYALTDEEVNDNYVLTCQSRPTCSDLSISFDA